MRDLTSTGSSRLVTLVWLGTSTRATTTARKEKACCQSDGCPQRPWWMECLLSNQMSGKLAKGGNDIWTYILWYITPWPTTLHLIALSQLWYYAKVGETGSVAVHFRHCRPLRMGLIPHPQCSMSVWFPVQTSFLRFSNSGYSSFPPLSETELISLIC